MEEKQYNVDGDHKKDDHSDALEDEICYSYSIVIQRTNGGMEKKHSNVGLTGNDNKTRKMDLCMVLINIESIL